MPEGVHKTRVFISRDIPEEGIRILEQEGFDLTVWKEYRYITQDELIEASRKSDALLCLLGDRIDKHFLNECRHLNVISLYSAGYNNIDIPEATKLKIPVGNTPGAMSEAAADIAFGLMIAAARKMVYMHKTILKGTWENFQPKARLGMELKYKTLGIFGMGKIGFAMAERCRGAYRMEILYCNRHENERAEKELGARRVSFEELLDQSDVLSVHCNLNPETQGLFNRTVFSRMKTTSLFINTSRGSVHNERDLIDALENQVIRGAGLDVTDPEPMKPDNPLLSMENVCVLPHIGSATYEARDQMARMAAENIIGYYRERKVPYILNPEALEM